MRVLILSAFAAKMKCGIGDYATILAHGLERNGCQVDYATAPHRPAQTSAPTSGRIRWLAVEYWTVPAVRDLAQQMAATPPDLIHLQFPGKPFRRSLGIVLAPYILRQRLKRPFVTTFHVLRRMVVYKKPPFLALAAQSDHIIVTASYEKELLQWMRLGERTTVIPIGSTFDFPPRLALSGEAANRLRAELGIGATDFVACNFGLIEPNKRLERIIAAAHELLAECPVHLVFIGPFVPDEDPYHCKLQRLVSDLGMEAHVHWLGFRTPAEIEQVFAFSDLAVLLYPDGISWQRTAFLAALGSELPVLANAGASLPNDIRHGQNVFLTPDSDAASLTRALRHLAANPQLRSQLAQVGLETFRSRPTWDDITATHLALYAQIIRRGIQHR